MKMQVFDAYHGCSTILLMALGDIRPMVDGIARKGIVFTTGETIHTNVGLKTPKPGVVAIQHGGMLYNLDKFASVLTITTQGQQTVAGYLTELGFKAVATQHAAKTDNTITSWEMSAKKLAAVFKKKSEDYFAEIAKQEALKCA